MVRYTLTGSAGTTAATDVSADLEGSSRPRRRPDRLREVGDPPRPGSDLDRAVGVAVASYGLGDGVGGAAPSGEHYNRQAPPRLAATSPYAICPPFTSTVTEARR